MKLQGNRWVGVCAMALSLLALCDTAVARPPMRGFSIRSGPPAHAPAHGYRHKQLCGFELVFDVGLGVYIAVGAADVYYHEGYFYRCRGGVWEISLRAVTWEVAGMDRLPPGLQIKAKSMIKLNGNGNSLVKLNGNGNDNGSHGNATGNSGKANGPADAGAAKPAGSADNNAGKSALNPGNTTGKPGTASDITPAKADGAMGAGAGKPTGNTGATAGKPGGTTGGIAAKPVGSTDANLSKPTTNAGVGVNKPATRTAGSPQPAGKGKRK